MVIRNDELDDLVIVRTDGNPTYNFAVVVDDLDMAVTHVVRGDDHVNNTPRQVHILRALGGEVPVYAHVPMILGPDGQRLSKRHGATSVTWFRDDGYLPEAMINHLARLGWSHGDQEIFSREELVRLFDIADVNRAAASFDTEKLDWLNRHYIKASGSDRLGEELGRQLARLDVPMDEGPAPSAVAEALRERAPDDPGDGGSERVLLPGLRRLRRIGGRASTFARWRVRRSRGSDGRSRSSPRGRRPAWPRRSTRSRSRRESVWARLVSLPGLR